MKQIDLDSMYSAAGLKKLKDLGDMESILNFIDFIQSIEIEEKYQPFEKPFIHLTERQDIEQENNPIFNSFLTVDRII